jgi:hypothetical protein
VTHTWQVLSPALGPVTLRGLNGPPIHCPGCGPDRKDPSATSGASADGTGPPGGPGREPEPAQAARGRGDLKPGNVTCREWLGELLRHYRRRAA